MPKEEKKVVEKHYSTDLMGAISAFFDKLTGNGTYVVDQGQITQDNRTDFGRKMDQMLQRNDNPVGYIYRTVMPAAAAVGGAYGLAIAPFATIGAVAGGVAADKATDAVSQATTGKTWSEHVSPVVGRELSQIAYPSMFVGGAAGAKAGARVDRNFSQLGRYTLDNLTPASYGGHATELFRVYTKPFYRKPPTFNNGRKPLWYNRYAERWGTDAAEQRFQNGAIWAQIPESEVPITVYKKNSMPNSYQMTESGLALNSDGSLTHLNLFEDKSADFFTKGRVGGEHSRYKEVGVLPNGFKVMEFLDGQQLNPQWKIARDIKKWFRIKKGSKAQELIDNKFGGVNISGLVGYKPFELRQNYILNPTDGKAYPINVDPFETRIKFNNLDWFEND